MAERMDMVAADHAALRKALQEAQAALARAQAPTPPPSEKHSASILGSAKVPTSRGGV